MTVYKVITLEFHPFFKGVNWFIRKMIQLASVTKVFAKSKEVENAYDMSNLTSKKDTIYKNWKLNETFEDEGLDGGRHQVVICEHFQWLFSMLHLIRRQDSWVVVAQIIASNIKFWIMSPTGENPSLKKLSAEVPRIIKIEIKIASEPMSQWNEINYKLWSLTTFFNYSLQMCVQQRLLFVGK